MDFINQYSILWTSLILLAVISYLLLRKGFSPQRGLVLLVIGLALLTGWLAIRPDQASTTDQGQFEAELNTGQAVLLELQSPF
jgi:hypothetical protein